MSQFYLDNQLIQFESGETILQAAQNAGKHIPVLCHEKEVNSCGNCMVCAVKDTETGKFLPSCSTVAVDVQKYESETQEVAAFRKAAIELLLAEHIGDCVAPCRLVCPQNLDIPHLMKMLSIDESKTGFSFNPEICHECGGRCEKACRRSFFDHAINIRALLKDFAQEDKSIGKKEELFREKYFHYLGKTHSEVLQKIYCIKSEDEKSEANRCLRCNCQAENACELRDMAFQMKANQAKFKLSDPLIMEPIFTPTIVYYPGKCIRCNRCVKLGEQLKPDKGPVMTGRGIHSRIDSPVGESFEQAFTPYEEKFIVICPTGALGQP